MLTSYTGDSPTAILVDMTSGKPKVFPFGGELTENSDGMNNFIASFLQGNLDGAAEEL